MLAVICNFQMLTMQVVVKQGVQSSSAGLPQLASTVISVNNDDEHDDSISATQSAEHTQQYHDDVIECRAHAAAS